METALIISQIASAVVLALTLVVVAISTKETADMAAATRQSAEAAQRTITEMRAARDQESAPYVVCRFDVDDQMVYFSVKNIGKTVATDIRILINPPLAASHGALTDIALVNDGIGSMPPGYEIRTFFDSTVGVFGGKDLPLRYEATVTYFGGLETTQRITQQVLDLSAYRGLLSINRKGMGDLVKEVDEIGDHLSHVHSTLKDLSETLETGVWIRNPDLLLTTRSTTGSGASDALATKLQEFKLAWDAAPRETSGLASGLVFRTAPDVQAHARLVGQQVLTLLAGTTNNLSDEVMSSTAQISAQLLQLGRMHVYVEYQEFNDAGGRIVDAIGGLLQTLSEHTKETIMEHYICVTCGTQFPASDAPPAHCPICEDDRQYIGPAGQQWTTLDALRRDHHNEIAEVAPGITSIRTLPEFAIGQQAQLIQTPAGNVLWDCISLLDDTTIAAVRQRGGLAAIAISHPHFYSSMIEWSRAFGGVPIALHASNEPFVSRSDPAIHYWEGETHEPLPGLTLIRCGGHFPGSTVLHWAAGADGRGALFTGDTITVVPDRRWVSFMYSYPNLIPLDEATVRAIVAAVEPYPFERVYGGWPGRIVAADGHGAVHRSAARYIAHLRGETR